MKYQKLISLVFFLHDIVFHKISPIPLNFSNIFCHFPLKYLERTCRSFDTEKWSMEVTFHCFFVKTMCLMNLVVFRCCNSQVNQSLQVIRLWQIFPKKENGFFEQLSKQATKITFVIFKNCTKILYKITDHRMASLPHSFTDTLILFYRKENWNQNFFRLPFHISINFMKHYNKFFQRDWPFQGVDA